MSRPRWLGLLICLVAAPAFADDDDDDERASSEFGVTPWFHFGPVWSTFAGDPVKDTVRSGMGLEANLQALVVLPGKRVGLGVVGGYLGLGGRIGEDKDTFRDLTGFQVMPIVMVSLFEVLSLYAKGGYAGGWVNSAEPLFDAVRFGGGLVAVILRLHASDLALCLDVMHTRLVGAPEGTALLETGFTSAMLGVSFTFDADNL